MELSSTLQFQIHRTARALLFPVLCGADTVACIPKVLFTTAAKVVVPVGLSVQSGRAPGFPQH